MLDPQSTRGLEARAVEIYGRAELYLIRVIRDAIIKAGEAPTWAEAQLLAIRQERGRIQGMAAALEKQSINLWLETIDAAYASGVIAAETELASIPESAKGFFNAAPGSTVVNDAAVLALASESVGAMSQLHQGILRATDDIWRRITAEAAGYTTSGAMTPQQAAQRAFTRMSRDGLGFFTDRAGRKWGLDTYAEMSVRTATNRALRAGHSDTMVEHGVDLVVVSSHPNPAPQCAPYERKVLSLTGRFQAGTHRIGDSIVGVAGTMAEAEADGLHHPNCRHRYSAYVPGFTNIDTPKPDPGHEGYQATQKQRYLERQIRASKRMEAAAIDPRDVDTAKQRIRTYQAKLRDHIKEHDLPRRRHREQLKQAKENNATANYGKITVNIDDYVNDN